MENKDKIILDLCGGTGAWSRPYKEAGYDVRVYTLPKHDILSPIVQAECFHSKPYGILSAPPCTMFSLARTTAKTPRNLGEGMDTVRACFNIIWQARIKGPIGFWALENPLGYLRQFLGRPVLTFQPNEFGNLHTKKTDLWGYFNIPKRCPIEIPNREKMQLAKNNRILPELPIGYKPAYGRNQAARRAMTPEGFAKAFFEANK